MSDGTQDNVKKNRTAILLRLPVGYSHIEAKKIANAFEEDTSLEYWCMVLVSDKMVNVPTLVTAQNVSKEEFNKMIESHKK